MVTISPHDQRVISLDSAMHMVGSRRRPFKLLSRTFVVESGWMVDGDTPLTRGRSIHPQGTTRSSSLLKVTVHLRIGGRGHLGSVSSGECKHIYHDSVHASLWAKTCLFGGMCTCFLGMMAGFVQDLCIFSCPRVQERKGKEKTTGVVFRRGGSSSSSSSRTTRCDKGTLALCHIGIGARRPRKRRRDIKKARKRKEAAGRALVAPTGRRGPEWYAVHMIRPSSASQGSSNCAAIRSTWTVGEPYCYVGVTIESVPKYRRQRTGEVPSTRQRWKKAIS